MSGTGLTVGEGARRSGLAVSALRFDDAQGLTASARTAATSAATAAMSCGGSA